jgi:hypothetical protein
MNGLLNASFYHRKLRGDCHPPPGRERGREFGRTHSVGLTQDVATALPEPPAVATPFYGRSPALAQLLTIQTAVYWSIASQSSSVSGW